MFVVYGPSSTVEAATKLFVVNSESELMVLQVGHFVLVVAALIEHVHVEHATKLERAVLLQLSGCQRQVSGHHCLHLALLDLGRISNLAKCPHSWSDQSLLLPSSVKIKESQIALQLMLAV